MIAEKSLLQIRKEDISRYYIPCRGSEKPTLKWLISASPSIIFGPTDGRDICSCIPSLTSMSNIISYYRGDNRFMPNDQHHRYQVWYNTWIYWAIVLDEGKLDKAMCIRYMDVCVTKGSIDFYPDSKQRFSRIVLSATGMCMFQLLQIQDLWTSHDARLLVVDIARNLYTPPSPWSEHIL